MSILIQGMEMPKNCGECPFIFSSWDIEYYCHLSGSSTSAEYVEREKMTNCPLIELPPHGRLIDADELVRIWKGAKFYGNIEPIVNARPTVIEAEGSETE